MNNIYEKKPNRKSVIALGAQTVLYFAVFLAAFLLNESHNFVAGILLILLAVESYLFFAIRSKDVIDMLGVFNGVWVGCIGLCMFRLSKVQVPWQTSSWVVFALIPVAFCAFFYGAQILMGEKGGAEKVRAGRNRLFSYESNKKIYLVEALICGAVAIVLMAVQYCIKGYFPMFSADIQSRFAFYTRLIVLVVATQASLPLLARVLREDHVKIIWKIFLIIGILGIFASTLLRVSRGDYILSALIIVPAVVHYTPQKKRILALVLLCVLLLTGYGISTAARKETSENLNESFQIKTPEEIKGGSASTPENPQPSGETAVLPETTQPSGDTVQSTAGTGLPKFITFPYFYLVNGFENFDYAVVNCTEFSHGLRQLTPFTVVLRADSLRERINALPKYENLFSTTSCIITDFYLDFGFAFVFIGMALLGFAVGIMHYYHRKGGYIASCVYGVGFAICTLSFFDTWLSFFTIWLFWGTCLLLTLPHIRFRKKVEVATK